MGRGADADFAARDRAGAENFAAAAEAAGVKQDRLPRRAGGGFCASRQPPRHRADAAVGQRSRRLLPRRRGDRRRQRVVPHCLPPRPPPSGHGHAEVGHRRKTQPIAIDDAISYLAAAAELGAPLDREIEVGGPDVTTYGGMIDELARAMGRRPPLRIVVPVSPYILSSAVDWPRHPRRRRRCPPLDRGPGDRDRGHRPFCDGTSSGIEPMPLATALRAALASTRSSSPGVLRQRPKGGWWNSLTGCSEKGIALSRSP